MECKKYNTFQVTPKTKPTPKTRTRVEGKVLTKAKKES